MVDFLLKNWLWVNDPQLKLSLIHIQSCLPVFSKELMWDSVTHLQQGSASLNSRDISLHYPGPSKSYLMTALQHRTEIILRY